MSDPTGPADAAGSPDSTPTEAIRLPGQPSAAPPSIPAVPTGSGNHTRTILEVVGGVVAVGLIFVAGVMGFFVGHATGSRDPGPWGIMDSGVHGRVHDGQRGPGELPGQDQWMPGDGWGQGPMMDDDGDGPGQGPMMDDESSESSQG